jgi:amino acid transporter
MGTTDEEEQQGLREDADGANGSPQEGRAAPLTPDLEVREVKRGTKPGSRYVRVQRRSQRPFERTDTGEYRATAVAIRPRSRVEAGWRLFKRIVVGAPLASSKLIEERLTKAKALAIFASDNLSSSAYATEEMLLVLVLAGTAAFEWSIPIAAAISVLVVIVALSYSQVIRAYPNGGGAYVVAKENLGNWPGYIAGASLIADYVLLVAVSIAAGVAAITSAIPELHDYRVPVAIGCVVAVTLGNLRGIRESASFFALPTYMFIVAFAGLLITGLVRLALGHDLAASAPEHPVEIGTGGVTIFLLLRAFSSGSAALTGIEAVSNGVPSLKPPEAKNAVIVLVWMVAILAAFFLGTAILAYHLDIVPSEQETVIAQIAEAVFGRNVFFYTVQMTTMFILILAANTSFAGLPSLASVMARDRVLPRQFSFRGDRLAFSNGIIVLGLASIGLLIVFQAETHKLIPLYAVGVFVGFTLAQAGLVRHWRRERDQPGAQLSLAINALGAVVTGAVTVIVAGTKFIDGAWLTIASIAAMAFFFSRIYHHYQRVHEQLVVPDDVVVPSGPRSIDTPPRAEGRRGRIVLVPVDELNQAVLRTVEFARSISDQATAVHVTDDIEDAEELRARWESTVPDTPIVIIESPYRSFLAPMLSYIDAMDQIDPEAYITVVLPEFVPAHFWEGILHNQSAVRLKKALLHRPNTVLIDVPYHLEP